MNDDDTVVSDQFQRARRPKSREVSSRFLSFASNSTSLASPNQALSPTKQNSKSSSFDSRKLQRQESSIFVQGLWPPSTSSSSSTKRFDTLADYLGNDRLNDQKSVNSYVFLNKQKSSSGFSRFEAEKCAKENDRTIISSSKLPIQSSESGQLSMDENALFGRLTRRKSDSFKNSIELESDCSDICSRTNLDSPGKTPTIYSQKTGIMVSSKYMNDLQRRPQRGSLDSNISNPVSLDSSPVMKRNLIKNAIKRANSLSGHGSSMTQWALSPGRSGSLVMSVENKEKPISFSSLKPIRTHSKSMGVEKLLNLGLDLFKSKKALRSTSSPIGPSISDDVHQLRMLHNRLIQWQFANAKAHAVSGNLGNSAETIFFSVWSGIAKLQHSVQQKKLQLQKEKLEFKLNLILQSQLKPLEAWGDMERQYLTALSMTKDCLHAVICRVPLIEGAKIDAQTISMVLRHASDLANSIKSMLITFESRANETASLLSKLAKVVAQEKLLLEESVELHRNVSALEMREGSLKCGIIQMTMKQHPQ